MKPIKITHYVEIPEKNGHLYKDGTEVNKLDKITGSGV